jgi:hypothetical protein
MKFGLLLYLTVGLADCGRWSAIPTRRRATPRAFGIFRRGRQSFRQQAILQQIFAQDVSKTLIGSPPSVRPLIGSTLREVTTMDELARPFVRLWDWVEQVGGFPGKVFFICAVIMLIVGGLTWYSNKR